MTDYTPTGKPDDLTRYDARAIRREFELIEAAVNSKSDSGSGSTVSTTSMLVESPATKTFTAETGKDFAIGQTVFIADSTDPATNNMVGTLTSYAKDTTGVMVVAVTSHNGSGTLNDWTIGVSNQSGVTLINNTFSGYQNFARATVTSHATTADIWNAAGNQINFTGTATVTDFPNAPQGGAERVLICADACSFVASADMTIDGVPLGGTLQCAAGDTVIVRAVSATAFKLSITRYLGSNGGSDTISSAVDVTLTSGSARLQIITMTAAGKKVNLPNGTTVPEGATVFVLHNPGAYPYSIMGGAGDFVAELKPTQSIVLSCSDNSTAAGVWRTHGTDIDKLDKTSDAVVINAVDSRELAIAPLTATSAICCFKNNSTAKLFAVVLNHGAAPGTPLQVGTDSVLAIAVAAQSPTQATVAYLRDANYDTLAYVLDIAGNTITPGTAKTVTVAGTGDGGVALSVLNSTQLLCAYITGTSAIEEVVFTISASVISLSATASATSLTSSFCYRMLTISATKCLLASGVLGSNTNVRLRLQSITAGTPAAVGSNFDLDTFGSDRGLQYGLDLVSDNRVLAAVPLTGKNCIMLTLLDVSGTTPTILRTHGIPAFLETTAIADLVRLTGLDKFYLSWVGESRGVDAATITVGSDDSITVSPIGRCVDNALTPGHGYLRSCALGADSVMQICRNSSTYLSQKVIGVP